MVARVIADLAQAGKSNGEICRREFKRRFLREFKRRHFRGSNFLGFPAKCFEVEMGVGIRPRTVVVDGGSG